MEFIIQDQIISLSAVSTRRKTGVLKHGADRPQFGGSCL